MCTLSELAVGGSMMIDNVCVDEPLNERMKVFGFLPETVIDKLYVGMRGSPIAVRVCGAVVALRRNDADNIFGESIMR